MEQTVVKAGNMLNPSLLAYKVPSDLDIPEVESIVVECTHPYGPYGAKGVGEATNVPTAPAVGNAVFDATGVRLTDLPMTPDRVLAAIREAGRAGRATT
jgi:CO/xanthine dehydrogenase Mo-binding subunit